MSMKSDRMTRPATKRENKIQMKTKEREKKEKRGEREGG
jgi:hypothetical protein